VSLFLSKILLVEVMQYDSENGILCFKVHLLLQIQAEWQRSRRRFALHISLKTKGKKTKKRKRKHICNKSRDES